MGDRWILPDVDVRLRCLRTPTQQGDATTMSLTDTDRAKLDCIASELNDLAEQHLLGSIDEASYAFEMNDVLAQLPTPGKPAHLEVLKRVKDWKEATLVPSEVATALQLRVVSASRNEAGAGGSSTPAAVAGTGLATPPRASPPPQSEIPPASQPLASPPKRSSPRLAEKKAKSMRKDEPTYRNLPKSQMQLSFGRTMSVTTGSGEAKTTISLIEPKAAPPTGAAKRKADEAVPEREARTVKGKAQDGTGVRVVLKLHLVGSTGVVAATIAAQNISAATVLGLKNKRRVLSSADKVKALDGVAIGIIQGKSQRAPKSRRF